jgi:UDP-N-acetylglucosamine 2-epimerase
MLLIETDPVRPVVEIASLMLRFERVFHEHEPAFVIPGGHDNASLAAALVAARMGIPVVSLDAGLRSYDRTEAAEINRLLIDSIAAMYFVSEHSGIYNLMNEGIADDRILFVGNTAIDSLVALIGRNKSTALHERLGIEPEKYITVLLSAPPRAETAGHREMLVRVLETLAATTMVIIPGGMASDEAFDDEFGDSGLRVIARPGYIDLVHLLKESAFVLTDTDEFEAELTVMNVPCLSMHQGTSRPSTVEIGTNVLTGYDEEEILERASVILSGKPTDKSLIPEKWDGAAALRVVAVLERAG